MGVFTTHHPLPTPLELADFGSPRKRHSNGDGGGGFGFYFCCGKLSHYSAGS